MRSSEFESSAPIEIESTKLAHPEFGLGLDTISGAAFGQQHHLQQLQQQQPVSRRQSRRLTRNFSIQPELEASCVLQRRPEPQLITGSIGLSGLSGAHVSQHSTASGGGSGSGGGGTASSGNQRRQRLKTRSTSVDIYSSSPRPSVASLYTHSNQYATPECCANCGKLSGHVQFPSDRLFVSFSSSSFMTP